MVSFIRAILYYFFVVNMASAEYIDSFPFAYFVFNRTR